jgi:murein L,D-transpeptidase YcbB/YkuD
MSWSTALALLVAVALPNGGPVVREAAAQTPLVLRLNVPAFRLDVIEEGSVSASYAVAVGEARYPTPLGEFQVTHITWNPWWHPPPSDWARADTVHPPGARNPMGPVKVQFGHLYFLHGTPYENTIGKAASHGCVRMRDADVRALARTLNREAGGGLSEAALDTIERDSSRTVTIELFDPVPIEIAYVTTEVHAERLYLHRDIYRRDPPSEARALETLAVMGYDTSRVDRPLLASLVRRARSRSASVAVDTLLGVMPIVAQSHGNAEVQPGGEGGAAEWPVCLRR